MKRLNNSILTLLMILFVGSVVAPTEATLIRHTFSGPITEVTGVAPAPWDGVHLGSAWEVSYVFDTGATDLNQGNAQIGRYFIEYGSVAIDGVSQDAAFGMIEILLGGFDRYGVTFFDLPLGAGANIGLTGQNALSSDELPINLDLNAFEHLRQFELVQNSGGYEIRGDVSLFTSEVVPSSGGILLYVLSLFARRERSRF